MSRPTLPERMFVDAAVFMYVGGGQHPLKAPCGIALRRAVEAGCELVTDSEVLQEILYRYFSIGRAATAATVFKAATAICDEVLAVQLSTTEAALGILLEAPSMSPRDAIHVASMHEHRIDSILTTDRDFDAIAGVTRVDPADLT